VAAGQVLQLEEVEDHGYVHQPETGTLADVNFVFRSGRKTFIENGMSGNLCVRREHALQIRGFDENFIPPVSYRFDNEFCKRLCRAGGKIVFEPKARIYHLRVKQGGTRTNSNHMTSISPEHGVGDYYFAFRLGLSSETLYYILRRPFREVRTKFHLRHPWWIPVKLVGEFLALFLALLLLFRGPRYLHEAENDIH
jgi:GT2 family glycosyltransferase